MPNGARSGAAGPLSAPVAEPRSGDAPPSSASAGEPRSGSPNHVLPRPDGERLGAMIALVLLASGLLRIVELPALQVEFGVLGLLVRLRLDTQFVMLTLAAGLAFTGVDWMLQSHPRAARVRPGLEHRVIPGLAALGLGAILARLPTGLPLAAGLGVAGLLLYGIFAAEFIVFEAEDPRAGWAALGLRTLSFLLLVGVVFAIRAARIRAAFAIPLVTLATAAVVWRILVIHSGARDRRAAVYAVVAGWIVGQLAWALHYWPGPPVRMGLLLGGAAYAGSGLVRSQLSPDGRGSQIAEHAAVAGLALALTLLLT